MLALHFNSEAGSRAVPERKFTCAAVLSQMVFLIRFHSLYLIHFECVVLTSRVGESGIDTRNMPFNFNDFIMHLFKLTFKRPAFTPSVQDITLTVILIFNTRLQTKDSFADGFVVFFLFN